MNKGNLWAIILLIVVTALAAMQPRTLEDFGISNRAAQDRKILIIYTGGTIGMKHTSEGYKPVKGYFEKQLKQILDLHEVQREEKISPYHIIEYDPLIDSSNMTPKDWNKMLRTIKTHYNDYDGFIIVHGTDTMAYSASALSFGLKGLGKPVVFTGSQIPLSRVRNDGINNMLCSLRYVSLYDIPEVVIVFGDRILRGNRAVKISSNRIDAFGSPNFRNIGGFGYAPEVLLDTSLISNTMGSYANSPFLDVIEYDEDMTVLTHVLAPGAVNTAFLSDSSPDRFMSIDPKIKGVIIRTFGIGDAPDSNKDFTRVLTMLKEKGITVLNISQCIEGRVDQGDYATGSFLNKNDVVSGQDLTYEAGYCKLLFLLGLYGGNVHAVREGLKANLAGELSNKLTLVDVQPAGI